MPLITWAYLGFLGGLFAGWSGAWPLMLVGGGALLILVTPHRSVTPAGVLACFAAGATIAWATPVRRGYGAPGTPSSLLSQQRAQVARRIDAVYRGDAPVVRALLIADRSGLSRATKEAYAAAGLVHVLGVSGLHVAIIAGVAELLLRLVRLPVRIAMGGAIGVTLAYITVIGFPLSAIRAGIMLAAAGVSRLAQRPTSHWATLAIGALLPLIHPEHALQIGYQLSVAGMAGVLAGHTLARRLIPLARWRWRHAMLRALITASIVLLTTAPLVAWSFGRVSLVSPVTNLFVAPLLGVLHPMLMLGVALASVPWLAQWCADAVHPLLSAIDAIATWTAAIPYASVSVHPTLYVALLAGVTSAATIVACVSRFPARATVLACGAFALLVWTG